MTRTFIVAAMLAVWAPVAALAQNSFQAGDFVSVKAGGAPLVRHGEEIAQLPENTWLEVLRTSGSWTAGHAVVDGQRQGGWVLTAKLAPESVAQQQHLAAAWEQAGARVEKNAQGAVLSIDATDSNVDDAHLAKVAMFPRLEALSLGGSKATEAGLAHVTRLPRLKRLSLEGLPVTDAGAKPLGRIAGLEVLSLADTEVSDAGLAHLSGLTDLQVLNLANCAITDAGLKHLAPLVNIETLALRNTEVRGQGLVHLAGMQRLNVLNLSECPIEGEHLLHLGGLQHLRILYLADCHVDRRHIEALENEVDSLAVFD